MSRLMLVVLLLLLSSGMRSWGQEALTNDSVVKLIKAGVSESVILSMITSQPGNYTVTADAVIRLKAEGVSEKVLAAMISKAGAGHAQAASGASPVEGPADSDLPKDMEIGAYYKKGGRWLEMMPEVVNWKTGGVIKTVVTVNVVKPDINGHIQGPHSSNSATSPLEVVIYTPEGEAITEYQLIHLREQKGSREFRTVTGGVFHASGGATRDVVPFEEKKVANRIYRVLLPNLGAGEYGFLPPGAISSASSASIGKMYTFRLVE